MSVVRRASVERRVERARLSFASRGLSRKERGRRARASSASVPRRARTKRVEPSRATIHRPLSRSTRWMVPPRKTRSRACPRRTRVHADGAVRVRDGDQRHAAERLIGAGPVQRPLRVRGRAGRRDLRGKINGHLSFEKLSDLVRVGPVPSALEACHARWMHLEPSLKERRLRPRTTRSRRRARAARGTPCVKDEGAGFSREERTFCKTRLFPTVAVPFMSD